MKTIATLLICCFYLNLAAQTYRLTVNVRSGTEPVLNGATVQLSNLEAKMMGSDVSQNGLVLLQNLSPGKMLLKVSKTGYMDLVTLIDISETKSNFYEARLFKLAPTGYYSFNGRVSDLYGNAKVDEKVQFTIGNVQRTAFTSTEGTFTIAVMKAEIDNPAGAFTMRFFNSGKQDTLIQGQLMPDRENYLTDLQITNTPEKSLSVISGTVMPAPEKKERLTLEISPEAKIYKSEGGVFRFELTETDTNATVRITVSRSADGYYPKLISGRLGQLTRQPLRIIMIRDTVFKRMGRLSFGPKAQISVMLTHDKMKIPLSAIAFVLYHPPRMKDRVGFYFNYIVPHQITAQNQFQTLTGYTSNVGIVYRYSGFSVGMRGYLLAPYNTRGSKGLFAFFDGGYLHAKPVTKNFTANSIETQVPAHDAAIINSGAGYRYNFFGVLSVEGSLGYSVYLAKGQNYRFNYWGGASSYSEKHNYHSLALAVAVTVNFTRKR